MAFLVVRVRQPSDLMAHTLCSPSRAYAILAVCKRGGNLKQQKRTNTVLGNPVREISARRTSNSLEPVGGEF